jgi:threonine/homoserine/homoserine lactone efflux protein
MDILSGIIMGIAYAATPGPVNVETIRRGLGGGFLDALAVQTGSAVGRIAYALLALFGAGLLLREAGWQLASGMFGVTALFYLGITTIRDGQAAVDRVAGQPPGPDLARRHFLTGAVLSLANPLAVVFWLAIGSRVVQQPGLNGVTFLAGFFAGCMLTSLIVATLASFFRSWLSSRTMLVVSWACGLVLIAFGFRLALSIGQTLF